MEVSHIVPASTEVWLSPVSTSPPDGTFVTRDEPILIHHYHSKSIVYMGFALDDVHSLGLDKCIMTCIHHYNILQSIFTALKFLRAPLVHPPLPPTPGSH